MEPDVPQGFELVPDSVSQKDLLTESYRLGAKRGYCTRDGLPPYRTKILTLCGFGEPKLNVWPRDKDGNLLD